MPIWGKEVVLLLCRYKILSKNGPKLAIFSFFILEQSTFKGTLAAYIYYF